MTRHTGWMLSYKQFESSISFFHKYRGVFYLFREISDGFGQIWIKISIENERENDGDDCAAGKQTQIKPIHLAIQLVLERPVHDTAQCSWKSNHNEHLVLTFVECVFFYTLHWNLLILHLYYIFFIYVFEVFICRFHLLYVIAKIQLKWCIPVLVLATIRAALLLYSLRNDWICFVYV